jgi:hypothetical protein
MTDFFTIVDPKPASASDRVLPYMGGYVDFEIELQVYAQP